jgi:hypothetical protein
VGHSGERRGPSSAHPKPNAKACKWPTKDAWSGRLKQEETRGSYLINRYRQKNISRGRQLQQGLGHSRDILNRTVRHII